MATTDRARPLIKVALPPISDDAAACIDRLVAEAEYLLMLGDDLDVCQRDVELLSAALRLRIGAIRHAYRCAEVLDAPARLARIESVLTGGAA